MTTERDPRDRIVLSWLREDAHENAERLLLRALDEVDTTPQRGPWSARRYTDMNTYAKLAIAAAAVVVVAFAGFQLLPRNSGPGAQPTATPSPTTSPTPAISDLPTTHGPLAPGRYALTWTGPPTSLEVPAGWSGAEAGVDKPKEGADVGWGGWQVPVTHVYSDACHSEGALEPVDGTLQGLVDALDAQVSTDATITDVTLGGRPATRIDLVPSPGAHDASCRNGAEGPLQIWADADETGFFAWYPGARGPMHVLEIDGELVVFAGIIGPEAAASDIAELEEVIASTQFGP